MAGEIKIEQAYAQGKMLDHSGWQGKLRGTPSDIDAVLDSGGDILFIELSRHAAAWESLSKGQLLLYQNLVLSSDRFLAALCKHKTPSDRQIDTLSGVHSFSLMFGHEGETHRQGPFSGDKWPGLVRRWDAKATDVREWILKKAGLNEQGPGAFSIPLLGGGRYTLSEAEIKKYEAVYGSGVRDELAKALIWLEANPKRRPKSNGKAFIAKWLGRETKKKEHEEEIAF